MVSVSALVNKYPHLGIYIDPVTGDRSLVVGVSRGDNWSPVVVRPVTYGCLRAILIRGVLTPMTNTYRVSWVS